MTVKEAEQLINQIIDGLKSSEDPDAQMILMTMYTVRATLSGSDIFKRALMHTLTTFNQKCAAFYTGREVQNH